MRPTIAPIPLGYTNTRASTLVLDQVCGGCAGRKGLLYDTQKNEEIFFSVLDYVKLSKKKKKCIFSFFFCSCSYDTTNSLLLDVYCNDLWCLIFIYFFYKWGYF